VWSDCTREAKPRHGEQAHDDVRTLVLSDRARDSPSHGARVHDDVRVQLSSVREAQPSHGAQVHDDVHVQLSSVREAQPSHGAQVHDDVRVRLSSVREAQSSQEGLRFSEPVFARTRSSSRVFFSASRRVAALFVLALTSGCFIPREQNGREDQTCTRCHGDSARQGDALTRAAPPSDTFSNSGVEFPGVGAHQRHLNGSSLRTPVACASCHVVPATPDAPKHNDGVTQVVLAGGGSWDLGARTCRDSGCHGAVSGVWTRPRAENEVCGTCHGLPPPSPHPQAGACAGCHGDVVAADGSIAHPEKHVDGTVQVSTACDTCHGSDSTGAPPPRLDGGADVGAHTKHLQGGVTTRPVSCVSCHVVPSTPAASRHPDGVVQTANFDTATQTCAASCHFGASPIWTSTVELGCTGCHGAPPPPPHPGVTQCSLCHPPVSATNRARHVDGHVDVAVPTSCNGCHGGTNSPAPPRSLDGGTDTTSPGVGAHQVHLAVSNFARTVQCEECHVVPSSVFSTGHLDGVTGLRFSGVAVANGATPSFTNGTCANTGCHDIKHFTGAPGGGTATTPRWTRVDGSQLLCDSCHGAPPPSPHPASTACETCHSNVTAQKTFVNPSKHINGTVDF
jgi:predicted CxxxxCH...CXXCH cytochrome family protein